MIRYIAVPKVVYGNPEVTNYELIVFITLQWIYSRWAADDFVFHIDMLSYYIYGSEVTKRQRELLCSAISNLYSNKIMYGEVVKGDLYRIRGDTFGDDGAGFALISDGELSVLKDEDPKLLRMWCYMVSSFNNKTHVSMMPLSYFADELGVSTRTIIRYNKRLEELGLLKIMHKHDGHKTINYYSRWSDKLSNERGGK